MTCPFHVTIPGSLVKCRLSILSDVCVGTRDPNCPLRSNCVSVHLDGNFNPVIQLCGTFSIPGSQIAEELSCAESMLERVLYTLKRTSNRIVDKKDVDADELTR